MTSARPLYRPMFMLACMLLIAGCGLFVNADERVRRATELLARGQYNEAMIEAQNALSSEPGNRAANLVLARIHIRMDNFDAAREAVAAAAAANGDAHEIATLRAELLLHSTTPGALLEALDRG